MPQTGTASSDVSVYSPATKTNFEFSGPPAPPLQLHFARLFSALAKEHGVKLVYLHLPESTEMRLPVVREKEFWPEAMNADLVMVGIAPQKLFNGLKDKDIFKLYLDPFHFNANGVKYFTPLVTPALRQIYEEANH
jgi:hypothetical protein